LYILEQHVQITRVKHPIERKKIVFQQFALQKMDSFAGSAAWAGLASRYRENKRTSNISSPVIPEPEHTS
jgi:hypothetical protein